MIPEGTLLNFPLYSYHHDEEYFPNPNKFDPERFNAENKPKIKANTYMPFGDGQCDIQKLKLENLMNFYNVLGPRNCIGLRFGQMQVKIGIVKLIRNYQFTANNKTTIPMKFLPSSIFLVPLNGMWLTVKKL